MKKGFTAEQIIKKLREAEVLQSKGETVDQMRVMDWTVFDSESGS